MDYLIGLITRNNAAIGYGIARLFDRHTNPS
ncbi:hypothetical protein SEEN953_06641 [Salmonella enterica subsp. enterica serovar Newport str. CVM 33953]|nr:hypothetical protein SEEN953_06641 [Salmonella enterica subsp. enterica serovar Newport str. CVM 33953]